MTTFAFKAIIERWGCGCVVDIQNVYNTHDNVYYNSVCSGNEQWWSRWWRWSERVYFECGDKHVTFTLIGAVSDLENLNGDGTLNDCTVGRGNRTDAATQFNRHRQYPTLYSSDDVYGVSSARKYAPRLEYYIRIQGKKKL